MSGLSPLRTRTVGGVETVDVTLDLGSLLR